MSDIISFNTEEALKVEQTKQEIKVPLLTDISSKNISVYVLEEKDIVLIHNNKRAFRL